MTKKIRVSSGILVLLFGLGGLLLLYPGFANWWNGMHQSRAIAAYAQQVSQLTEADYTQYWEDAQTYNHLLAEGDADITQSYETLLDPAGSGVMGYLEIPAIDCVLPIRHGSSETVLRAAVGHLEWSSLPVGGTSAHCVLSGHRGLPSAKLFTDLDKLVIGDVFHLQVLGTTLTYRVDQILTVLPGETGELRIKDGQDYCTLVTCTPYAINTHRLLVRGCRVETQPPEDTPPPADAPAPPPYRPDPSWFLALIFLPPFLFLFLYLRRISRRENGTQSSCTTQKSTP